MPGLDNLRISIATAEDLGDLHRGLPTHEDDHASRLARSRAGRSALLLAWIADDVVGRGELMWEPKEDEVRRVLPDVPELNGLDVAEAWRNRGVGTALVAFATRLAAERGCTQIGLGVGRENPEAYRLYRRLGFDGELEYTDRYRIEADGRPSYFADPCRFLTRALS